MPVWVGTESVGVPDRVVAVSETSVVLVVRCDVVSVPPLLPFACVDEVSMPSQGMDPHDIPAGQVAGAQSTASALSASQAIALLQKAKRPRAPSCRQVRVAGLECRKWGVFIRMDGVYQVQLANSRWIGTVECELRRPR